MEPIGDQHSNPELNSVSPNVAMQRVEIIVTDRSKEPAFREGNPDEGGSKARLLRKPDSPLLSATYQQTAL